LDYQTDRWDATLNVVS